jgi:ribosomal protein S27E
VLYRLVKEHGAEFLRHARDSYDGPLPRYVEDELRGYVRCGDFSRGFVHLRCRQCAHDLLVAFSCASRALCPSCAGRRMAAQAAHLVDRILPAVPLRQFVLSFPFELSLLAATKPDVLRDSGASTPRSTRGTTRAPRRGAGRPASSMRAR